jgi:antitoxin component of RelBE/YafQ-DinJ toxin-antitoxin module
MAKTATSKPHTPKRRYRATDAHVAALGVTKTATATDAPVPEIRYRPSADLYAKAARVADQLGISVTEVARIGLAQISNARAINLEPQPPELRTWRDTPIHGVTVGRVADIAAEAARAADRKHVGAGRLNPVEEHGTEP